MPILFLECPDEMIAPWQRVLRSDDPPIRVNIVNGQPHNAPALLDGYDVCLNDHTYLNAELLGRCHTYRTRRLRDAGSNDASAARGNRSRRRGQRVRSSFATPSLTALPECRRCLVAAASYPHSLDFATEYVQIFASCLPSPLSARRGTCLAWIGLS